MTVQDTHSGLFKLEISTVEADFDVRFEDSLPTDFRTADNLWLSNGGESRSHPSKGLPFTLECSLDTLVGIPKRLDIIGVFARFAKARIEPPGTLGASVQLYEQDDAVFRLDLIQGRHYGDASDLERVDRQNGDGSSLHTCGSVTIDGETLRLDRLSVDIPNAIRPERFVFRDLGTPASFAMVGLYVETEVPAGCPFHSKSGLIPLREVSAIVRVGDRRKFSKALSQLSAGVRATEDLDEARGQALTFLAVVTAGMLESGGSKQLHRIQLDAARKFETMFEPSAIADAAVEMCESIAAPLFKGTESPSGHLVDRALGIVDRNFAKPLTDSMVAEQLGLSTSHFRFLFKQATGRPFHKYLIAVRLEKAKQMLLDQGLPVSQVAAAVGFTGLSHFSRAFTQRFKASPTSIKRQSA